MKKTYEHCPRCGKKGLFLTGPRSWDTTFTGKGTPIYRCRYCSFMETRSEHDKRA